LTQRFHFLHIRLRRAAIETPATLPVGQTIELKVRDSKTNKIRMLSGEIVRSRPGGVGIRVKKICDANAEKRF